VLTAIAQLVNKNLLNQIQLNSLNYFDYPVKCCVHLMYILRVLEKTMMRLDCGTAHKSP